jgi:SAM-dependent methyltransferase
LEQSFWKSFLKGLAPAICVFLLIVFALAAAPDVPPRLQGSMAPSIGFVVAIFNPDAARSASSEVSVLKQDCSVAWSMPPQSLDVVFTSNFFEHLPTKYALEQTLLEAYKALRPGGRLIAMGPNIKYLPGTYWDFFDHYLPLTELSLIEVLRKCGFQVVFCRDRYLPYTMSDGLEYSTWILRLYLKVPFAWRFFGKQFLVVAEKKTRDAEVGRSVSG